MIANLRKTGMLLLLAIAMAAAPLTPSAQASHMASAMQAADTGEVPAAPCGDRPCDHAGGCSQTSHVDCAISCAANCAVSAAADIPAASGTVSPTPPVFGANLPVTAASGAVAIEPTPPRASITR